MNSEIPQTIESLASPPFPCPNCDEPIGAPTLFCSDLCRDEAKFVRYYRACIKDGRIKQPDVVEALQIRMAHILGGGYAERERRLSLDLRGQVIERAKGLCQSCGALGNQVDHISGNSSNLSNLQLLCVPCHNEKTTANFVQITEESHPEAWAKRDALLRRVHSAGPVRFCDRAEWATEYRALQQARKHATAAG